MDRDDAGCIARSVVGHPYRRILLSFLDSQGAPVPLRDLSWAILALDRSDVALPSVLALCPGVAHVNLLYQGKRLARARAYLHVERTMTDDYVRRVAVDILRNPHRRYILSHLNGQQDPLTVRRLAEAIRERESAAGEHREDVTPDGLDVEELMVRLHHEHLPYLDANGVLTYDWRRREISDWRHPNLGDEWVSSFPIAQLYEVIR